MKILPRLYTFIVKRSNKSLNKKLFSYFKNFTSKRNSGDITTLKTVYKSSPNSVFQESEIITDKKSIKKVENLVNNLGIEYGADFSMATRNLSKIKYKKSKTIEEAKEYAEKVLKIKSFDIPDLDLANQINLSITNAIKKAKRQIRLPDIIEMTPITSDSGKFASIECPAETTWFDKTNEMTLRINKDYYNDIDNKINSYLEHFKKNGQLSTNSRGRACIDLISFYKYDSTLNRYYRLWKQGKLTQKAKLDFDNLLKYAREEEQALLSDKECLTTNINERLGINLSNLSQEEYNKKAIQALLKLRKEQKILLGTDYVQTKNAIGFDSCILHELGHVTHFKKINFKDFTSEVASKFDNPLEIETALCISPYATENKGEMIAEYIKGILSGDKYSDDVNLLFEKYFKGKFNTSSSKFIKLG